MVCDISQRDQVQKLVEKAKSMGRLRALIHTAGLSPALAPADRIIRLNAVGTALILDAFYEIAETGSVILVIATNAGHLVSEDPELDKIMDNALDDQFLETILGIVRDDAGCRTGCPSAPISDW